MSGARWMKLGVATIVVAILAACAMRVQGISDDRIGLSKVDVREVPDPPAVQDNTMEPGESTPRERPWEGAPPVISHSVADLPPITQEDNFCIDCHRVEDPAEGDPTPLPQSHFIDLRRGATQAGEEIAGARYNCLACHAPQTNAPPLSLTPTAAG